MKKILLFDLDGTIYRGKAIIEGVKHFFESLDLERFAYCFITNRCNRSPKVVAEHIQRVGIACNEDQVLTSAHAIVYDLLPGEYFAIGEDGLIDILEKNGFSFTDKNPKYVMIGFDESLTYAKLSKAVQLVLSGSELIASNDDALINTEAGMVPENGPVVAAIEYACKVKAKVMGKPQPILIKHLLKKFHLKNTDVLMIGDNFYTDVLSGINAGVHAGLILTGVTTAEEANKLKTDKFEVFKDYEELTQWVQKWS